MFDGQTLRRHRLSALANGVLIGMGIALVLVGFLPGAITIIIGVGIELWQRSRIPKEPSQGPGAPPRGPDSPSTP